MKKINWETEIRSIFHTFVGMFVGALLATPLINAMLGTSLPTVDQFKDVFPIILDTVYRAAWMTFLIKVGLKPRPTLDKDGKTI